MTTPGTLLVGRYRLVERIGAGAMGEVWRATDETLQRRVAVKIVLPALVEQPGFTRRFRAEARTMASIDHPGVVGVYDYHDGDSGAFLVMEFVAGEPLSDVLARERSLPPARAMEVVAQAAEALQAAHERGIIHRDVKPANLLVRANGQIVLTDFGIARAPEGTQLTATGAVLGTPSYLAPEQVLGDPATPRSDIYALGVVAYECLAGRRPFVRENAYAAAVARVREAPPPLPAEVPARARMVVERALAADPAQRWPSAAELAAAWRQPPGGPPPGPPMPGPPMPGPLMPGPPPVPVPARPPRRRVGLAVFGGVAGAVVIVTGLVLAFTAVSRVLGDDSGGSGESPGPSVQAAGPGGCEGAGLPLGAMVPLSGALAFFGPPQVAAIEVAVAEVNESGGVGGECVEITLEDSGDSDDSARRSAEALIDAGVSALIGPSSSSRTLAVIDMFYEHGVVQVSPANSATELATHDRGDYYFRTAPSNQLLGTALGDLVLDDGNDEVAILAVEDSYGDELREPVRASVERSGGEVTYETTFAPGTSVFAAEAGAVADGDADAVVLITGTESLDLAEALADAEMGPDRTNWYLVDANLFDDYPSVLDSVAGVRGIIPGADPEPLRERMLAEDPDLDDFSYGPEAYDAVILVALAAVAAGSSEPDAIRDRMVPVSDAPGTTCETFAACAELLAAGDEIDYDGLSGPIDWDANGDPTAIFFAIHEYDDDDRLGVVDYRVGRRADS